MFPKGHDLINYCAMYLIGTLIVGLMQKDRRKKKKVIHGDY